MSGAKRKKPPADRQVLAALAKEYKAVLTLAVMLGESTEAGFDRMPRTRRNKVKKVVEREQGIFPKVNPFKGGGQKREGENGKG